jgi:hypothetical protein
MTVFWDFAPCSLVESLLSFQRCLLPPSSRRLIALMMEASTSETSVNFYQTTRRNISEVRHLHTRRRENPKSHPVINLFLLV